MRQVVFVCGCPRSGTTALAMLLNHHPDVCIGIERFSRLILSGAPPANLFSPERFKDVRPGDTFHEGFRPEERGLGLPGKIDTARVVGDKIPRAYRLYDRLAGIYPGAKFVFIVRLPEAVAASYQNRASNPNDRDWREGGAAEAITAWNDAVERTIAARHNVPILSVGYERLFNAGAGLDRLASFLGIDTGPLAVPLRNIMARGQQIAQTRRDPLSDRQRSVIRAACRLDLQRALLDGMAEA